LVPTEKAAVSRNKESLETFLKRRHFIPFVHFESWLEGEQAFVLSCLEEANGFTRDKGLRFVVLPAFKFVRIEDGHDDSAGFIGRVMSREEIDPLKPDVFRDTIRLGEKVYRVELGYVGELRNGDRKFEASGGDAPCSYCRSLTLESSTRSLVYRCVRFHRVVFAEFGDSFDTSDATLFPLSRYCRRIQADDA
jgi:hypothetical protein